MAIRRREYEVFDQGWAGARAMIGFFIGFLLVGLPIMGLYNWIAGGLFDARMEAAKSTTIAAGIGLIGAAIGYFGTGTSTVEETETDYYCADCGQLLGTSPRQCSRCGCNRYTTDDTGVGRRVRRG